MLNKIASIRHGARLLVQRTYRFIGLLTSASSGVFDPNKAVIKIPERCLKISELRVHVVVKTNMRILIICIFNPWNPVIRQSTQIKIATKKC